MQEILTRRGYKHKHFDLGTGQNAAVFHQSDIHYIPPGQSTFEDVDFSWEDKGTYREMTRASYRLYVAKDFGASQLIRFDNRYKGANHSIYYEPDSIWWVNRYDYSIRQLFRSSQNVTGVLEGHKIVYYDAFGSGFDFVVELRRDGFRKYLRINQKSAWGTPPSADHWPVALFKYTGAGLTVRADDAQDDWDENSLYESGEGFIFNEVGGYQSKLLQGFIRDSSIPYEQQSAKMFFEKRSNALWQAKVLPRNFLENATYPVYADDSVTFTPHSADGNCYSTNELVWATARNHAGSGVTDPTSPDRSGSVKVWDAGPDTVQIWRGYFSFDSSSLDAGDAVTLAKFRRWADINICTLTDYGLRLYKCSLASDTALVAGDFDAVTSGGYNWDTLSAAILYANLNVGITSGDVNEWTLTDNSYINKGGYTHIAEIDEHDGQNHDPLPVSGGNKNAVLTCYFEDAADTYDPELYVEYTPAGVDIKKVIDETEQVGEASLRPRVMFRIKTETENISEATPRLKSMVRLIADTVNLVEAKIKVFGFVRVIDETLNISEAKNYLKAMFRFGNDSVNISEGTLRPRVLKRVVDEDENLSEATLRPRVMKRVVDEAENVQESVSRLKSMVRVLADAVNLSEAKVRVLGFVRIVDDTLNITETKNRVLGFIRVISETVNLVDGTVRFRALVRIVADTVNISEVTLFPRVLVRLISSVVNLGESTTKSRILIRLISDSLNISENISRVRGIVQVISDVMNISEVLNWIKTVPDAIKIFVRSLFNRTVTKTSSRSDTVSISSSFDKTVEHKSKFIRVLKFKSKFETEEL